MIVTKLGAIDIGSNSVRCLIVNVIFKDGYTYYKKVSMIRLPVRLGQDVFKYGKIRKITKDRFLEGMKAYDHLLSVRILLAFPYHLTNTLSSILCCKFRFLLLI